MTSEAPCKLMDTCAGALDSVIRSFPWRNRAENFRRWPPAPETVSPALDFFGLKLRPCGSSIEICLRAGACVPARAVNLSLALRFATPVSDRPDKVGLPTPAAARSTLLLQLVAGPEQKPGVGPTGG